MVSCPSLSQTQINGGQIKNGAITNAKVADNAAISYTKINFTGSTPPLIGAEEPLTFTTPLNRVDNTISFLVADIAHGGTGLTSIGEGLIPFGGASTYETSSTFNWDKNSGKLTITNLRIMPYSTPPPGGILIKRVPGHILTVTDVDGNIGFTDPTAIVTIDGVITAGNFVASKIDTPTISSLVVKLASITTIEVTDGASYTDGDYFTLNDGTSDYIYEFDTNGDVTLGSTPITISALETDEEIRDLLINVINNTVGIVATAETALPTNMLLIIMDVPGTVGGTNSENVTPVAFTVSAWVDSTVGTTYSYIVTCYENSQFSTEGSVAVSEPLGPTTMNGHDVIEITWDSKGAAFSSLYRSIDGNPYEVLVTNYVGTTFIDNGGSGITETPPVLNNTGKIVASKAKITDLVIYADNAAALAAGLSAGELYVQDDAGEYFVKVVH